MSFTFNSALVAQAEFRGMSIRPSLGHYLLAFTLKFETPAYPDGAVYWLTNVHAKAQVCPTGQPSIWLGRADTDLPIAVRAGTYPQKIDHLFEVRLSPQELQALENLRNGGDLRFAVQLNAQVAKPGGDPQPAHQMVHGVVVQSEWIKELNSSGFSNTILIEVPLAVVGSKKVGEQLHQARELLLAGRYSDVVAKCRIVLESVDDVARASTANVLELYQKSRQEMTVAERLQFLRDIAKNYTHPAHHGDKKAVDAVYTRSDASMILAVAAALASHADVAASP
ncbi:MAG: hypothetical protein ISP90_11385 [Nevskia sp.]|nr:hypothetical protein [Nevskia sp.]